MVFRFFGLKCLLMCLFISKLENFKKINCIFEIQKKFQIFWLKQLNFGLSIEFFKLKIKIYILLKKLVRNGWETNSTFGFVLYKIGPELNPIQQLFSKVIVSIDNGRDGSRGVVLGFRPPPPPEISVSLKSH